MLQERKAVATLREAVERKLLEKLEMHAYKSSAMSVCESKEKLRDFSLVMRHIQKYLRFPLENLLTVNS